MNRWKLHSLSFFVFMAAMLTALTSGLSPAQAQAGGREFPASALRGKLRIGNPPEAMLDGQPVRLSPGARIRGVNNMLVMSGSLAGQNLLVNYVRDGAGDLREVWILSGAEAREKRATAEPASNIISSTEEQRRLDAAGKTRYDQQPKYQQK